MRRGGKTASHVDPFIGIQVRRYGAELILLAMIHAERESPAEEKTPYIADHCSQEKREPVHSGTAPAVNEDTEGIDMEIVENRINLHKEVPVEHAEDEDDCKSTAETVCPL